MSVWTAEERARRAEGYRRRRQVRRLERSLAFAARPGALERPQDRARVARLEEEIRVLKGG